MTRLRLTILCAFVAVCLVGCMKEELPSRDEIPVLRSKLYALEQGILNRNRAALDSLLSVEILEIKQSSDSLLSFVYGPDQEFPFFRLGNYEIMYSKKLAFIECFAMDSLETTTRPIKFTFKNDEGIWLLKKFEPGTLDTSSVGW